MIRKFIAALALAAAATLAFVIPAFAQSIDPGQVVGLVCAHQDAAVYLLTAFGIGSVLSWFKGHLPAPIAHAANLASLNWDELVPVAKALWAAMKTPVGQAAVKMLAVAVISTVALSACSKNADQSIVAASQSLAQGAQTIQTVLVTVQPVASNLACDVQTASNAVGAGAGGTAGTILKGGAGNTATQVAIGAETASKISGTFCNNKSQGQTLPTPVPVVAGASAVINGVTLPVPVAAVQPAAPQQSPPAPAASN